jgi:DNA-binding GntR family transcriptional regulator
MMRPVADAPAARQSLAERMRPIVDAERAEQVTALEMVLSAVRTGILSGVIEPGERLRQEELAEIFDTSRIPVREALRALEYEGLVTSEPHRGFTVTTLDADHITEIYELRSLLESQAVRLAVPLLTDEDLRDLEQLSHQMADASNPEAALAARERFYLRLYSVSGRPRLVGLIARLRQEVARTLRWPTLQHASSFHEHFWEAVKEGEAERAVSQLTAHYGRVATLIRRYLREAEMRGQASGTNVDRWLLRSVERQ